MRMRRLAAVVLTAAVIGGGIVGSAHAALIKATVTVNKLDGTILTWKSAQPYGGKSASLSRSMPKGDPGPLPPGSFYFKVGYTSDPVPAQVWVGTDNYYGLYLRDITKLEYYSYMVNRGEEATPPSFYPYQPIQLQLHTSKDGGGGDPHYLMFRPWGRYGGGDPSGSQCGEWQYWNCMSSAYKWYDQQGVFDGVWKHWLTWSEIIAYYPNAMIDRCTAGNSFPGLTPTGYGLNFAIGGRMTSGNGQSTPDWDLLAWWREGYNAEGSLDSFTIGVRKSNGDIKENTFDFDVTTPAARPPVYALNNKAAVGGNWWLDGDVYSTSNPYGIWTGQQVLDRLTEIQKNANNNTSLFAVFGKVKSNPAPDGNWFTIDDGAGLNVRVYAQGKTVYPGDYVRVKGSLRVPMPYDWGQARAYDHSAPGVLNTSTQPYIPTLPVELHSFAADVQVLAR